MAEHFLPDGRHFVYLVQPGNHIYYGSLDGTPPKRLVDADAKAVYARGGPGSRDAGYLLYQLADVGLPSGARVRRWPCGAHR